MSIAISLSPGDVMYVSMPINNDTGSIPNGSLPYEDTFNYAGRQVRPLNGFFLENDTVGTLELVTQSEAGHVNSEPLSVKYTHNKLSPNRIFFIDFLGEQSYIDIVPVPIHDHSSVFKGGPAHGTYSTRYTPPE